MGAFLTFFPNKEREGKKDRAMEGERERNREKEREKEKTLVNVVEDIRQIMLRRK